MVERQIRVSDLSGEEGAKTIRFGLHEQMFEVDLTDEEAQAFEAIFERLTRRAGVRKVNRTRPVVRRLPVTTAVERGRIRAWARQSLNAEIQDKGLVPNRIVRAYDKHFGITRVWVERTNGHRRKQPDTGLQEDIRLWAEDYYPGFDATAGELSDDVVQAYAAYYGVDV